MKRMIFTLLVSLLTVTAVRAIPFEEARQQALFLTDKMAYELNLNEAQYNDAYEINLDFFLNLRTAQDANGYLLQCRNDDLRYILYDWQYELFRAIQYLFHPVTWRAGVWYFPIYVHYHVNKYFYPRPKVYWIYRGGHSVRRQNKSYYAHRRPAWNGGLRGPGIHHKPGTSKPKPQVRPTPERKPKPQVAPKPQNKPKPQVRPTDRNTGRRPKVERQREKPNKSGRGSGYNHRSSTRTTVHFRAE